MKGGFFGSHTKTKVKPVIANTAATPVPPVSEPVLDAPVPASVGPDTAPTPPEAGPSSAADPPAAEPIPEAEDDEGTGMMPNTGNGLDLETYTWTQTLAEVTIMVKVPKGTRGRDCNVVIENKKLVAGLKGQPAVLEGVLDGEVVVDECYWNCDGSAIEVTLQKKDRMSWWKTTVEGEPELNTRKVGAAAVLMAWSRRLPMLAAMFQFLYVCVQNEQSPLLVSFLCDHPAGSGDLVIIDLWRTISAPHHVSYQVPVLDLFTISSLCRWSLRTVSWEIWMARLVRLSKR